MSKPPNGVSVYVLVDEQGVAKNGTATVEQLRRRGLQPICQVDTNGDAEAGSSIRQIMQRGIEPFCPVDETGSADDGSTSRQLLQRGILPLCPVDENGIAQGGTATVSELHRWGIKAFCPVDENGDVVSVGGPTPDPVAPIDLSGVSISPAAFYSTVQLSTYSATGPCVGVVRASDSTETTINFLNGTIDMVAAIAFAGGSALTISTWYDQSGNGLNATASSNRPNLSVLNDVNGLQAIGFDGSNGTPVITKQMAVPGLALDIANLAIFMAGRQTISQNLSCWASLSSITPATIASWQTMSGPSYVATSTQTQAIYCPTNPAIHGLSRGATSGAAGAAGLSHYMAERTFTRAATTGVGTSVDGIIGNTVVGTARGCYEAVALVFFAGELSTANATALKTALAAPFPTPIQTSFEDTMVIEGDSIAQGTGTSFNQNITRQLLPLLERPTRLINAGVFGATMNSLISTGTGKFTPFGGWTDTNNIWVLESGVNDLATAGTNQGLSTVPTIAAGGTGYAASSTFNVTTAGGTGTQAVISVTTDGSGVVTTVNGFTVIGNWSVLPSTPNTPTGGTGTGLTLNLTFAQINSAALIANLAKQLVRSAKASGQIVGICTLLPRSAWIGSPAPWVQGQAYNDDLRTNGTVAQGSGGFGADFIVDIAGDATLGNISNWAGSPNAITDDGTHLNNGGTAIAAPIYAAARNALI